MSKFPVHTSLLSFSGRSGFIRILTVIFHLRILLFYCSANSSVDHRPTKLNSTSISPILPAAEDRASLMRAKSVKLSLSHIYHQNSSLFPDNCDHGCMNSLILNQRDISLARLEKRSLSAQTGVSHIYLTRQHVATWYVGLQVGTNPSQDVKLVLDTGSAFTWLQCRPCVRCFPQRTKLFNPDKSSTFKELMRRDYYCRLVQQIPGLGDGIKGLSCRYYQRYDDTSYSRGYVVQDTFQFKTMDGDPLPLPFTAFGCGEYNEFEWNIGASGVFGLGRAGYGITIPEQLDRNGQVGRSFSYCLPVIGSPENQGFLILGDDNLPVPGQNGYTSTNFLRGGFAGYYYLDVVDFMINGQPVGISADNFRIQADGNGGVILDSGTMLNLLAPNVFTLFRDAYRNGVREILGSSPIMGTLSMDTCYDVTNLDTGSLELPEIGLILETGQVLKFVRESTFFLYNSRSNRRPRPFLCMPFVEWKESEEFGLSIIGGYVQMQTHMVFDQPNQRLLWKNLAC